MSTLSMERSRRRFLASAGGVTLAALGGCGSPGGDPEGTEYVPAEPDYKGWFDGVSNYRQTVEARGESDVVVDVGVRGQWGFYQFGPAAVAVSPGTMVTWEWTGRGGTHNVVSRDGVFDSGELVDSADYRFQYTFDSPGIYYYVCEPHVQYGMKGAVFVALDEE